MKPLPFLGISLLLGVPLLAVVLSSQRDDEPLRRSPAVEFQTKGEAEVLPSMSGTDELSTERTAPHQMPERIRTTSSSDPRASLATLRSLQQSDPTRTLQIIETENWDEASRTEKSERDWFRARALVELGRFGEAREVAQAMVEAAPETSFTSDVRRHLLSHPFGLPPRKR